MTTAVNPILSGFYPDPSVSKKSLDQFPVHFQYNVVLTMDLQDFLQSPGSFPHRIHLL